ncbi:MAG: hypothetical protein LBO66_09035 [Deltaproteobacteria bacterium]|jgi:hypothetical protein|nr:hypothetical protein [Deltaproteobacteria bacterium]
MRVKSLWAPLLLFSLCLPFHSDARGQTGAESVAVANRDGEEIFRLDFPGKAFPQNLLGAGVAPRELEPSERAAVQEALSYWAQALIPFPCQGEAGSDCLARALAGGDNSPGPRVWPRLIASSAGEYNFVLAQNLLARGLPRARGGRGEGDFAVAVSVGEGGWSADDPFGPITRAPASLRRALVGELARGLGLVALSAAELKPGARDTWFGSLVQKGPDGSWLFQGQAAGTVYGDGAFKPIPVRSPEDAGGSREYLALKRTLLSGGAFQNYNAPVEAELAALRDIGYDVNPRDFYGRSIYLDGSTVVNGQGFLSAAPFGVGLHVYGSFNTVTQEADLSASGPGGAGARVDGVANNLAIGEQAEIRALGAGGAGVLVAFGNGHSLTARGAVFGKEDAFLLDIGINPLDDPETRNDDGYGQFSLSSFYQAPVGAGPEFVEAESALNGPLVTTLALHGLVQGEKRAVYLSPNAFAEKIAVLRGAAIWGDIISDYDDRGRGTLKATTLVFGARDATGLEADPDFEFTLRSRILGSGATPPATGERLYLGRGLIDLVFLGGAIEIADSARVEVRGLAVESGVTVKLRPDLASLRPIFLEAKKIRLEEGSTLLVSASTTQTERSDWYFTPILKLTQSGPGEIVNRAQVALDPESQLAGGELAWWNMGPNELLLVYLRPGARFPR